MRDALATHHMGRVVYVYRNHPWHRQALKQSVVAGWFGLTQAQLSRIETGRAPGEIGKLIRWAEVLRIPAEVWWFKKRDVPAVVGPTAAPAVAARTSAVGTAGSSAFTLTSKSGTGDVALMIAGESAGIASSEAARMIPPMSVAQLSAELARLAREYAVVPPLLMLSRARELRDESHRLSERTRLPAQLAELHLVTGAACGLLAMSSWDLGAWSAAIEQSHAAGLYGQMIGHDGLQAWVAGTEALIAFWRGRPRDAIDAVSRGLQLASAGTPQARLHCIAARAWACLGASDQVKAELRAADLALGHASGPNAEFVHDEIAGEFGWGPARHAMCAATALLVAEDLDSAADRARVAIAAQACDPVDGNLVTAKAHADLACVELTRGRLDAAEDALNAVWDVDSEFRAYPLVGRVETAKAMLAEPRYAQAREAVDLSERLRAYCGASAGH